MDALVELSSDPPIDAPDRETEVPPHTESLAVQTVKVAHELTSFSRKRLLWPPYSTGIEHSILSASQTIF